MSEERTLRIYLKSKRKPLVVMLNDEQYADFKAALRQNIVIFGPIIFSLTEFLYATLD